MSVDPSSSTFDDPPETHPHALARALSNYRLVLVNRKLRGRAGALLGHSAGSSVEFQDYRSYTIGDDPRHIDWSVYARTRSLTVRLYRDEVRPHLDIVLDTSRSMALADGTKAHLGRALALFAQHSGRQQGFASTLYSAGTQLRRCQQPTELEALAPRSLLFEAPQAIAHRLAPGGARVVISDFLAPLPPSKTLVPLARGASLLLVIMTLGPWEADPPGQELLTLVDAETGQEQLVSLSEGARQRYRERLGRLRSEVRSTCQRLGARYVELICRGDLEHALRSTLLPARIVEPL